MENTNNSSQKRQDEDAQNRAESIKLIPQFDSLQQPETFINHIQDMQKELKAKENPFPIEVFPKAVQEIITDTNDSLNYPIDFIGASILYAVSVSIGNTYRVEIKKGWEENAVLYLAIVGRAGTNKSHPVSFSLKPIEQRDTSKFQKYQKEKQEFDTISALTKKDREQQGHNEPVKPFLEQHLVTDFTIEALTDVHKFNKRGVGVYVDELATWFKNFNRYNNGSEEQFWLSVWSGKAIRINRKTTEPTFIAKPFISVIGTIQPAVLNELADKRMENGFLDRLLFVAPENLKKEYWSETELNPVTFENWQTIISSLLDLSIIHDETDNPQPEVLRFTPDAKKLLYEWQKTLTDQSNKPENESISGINAKMEMYAIRLALILQMVRYACNEDEKQAVGLEAVKGSLNLVEYFKRTAIRVHSLVKNANPLDKLPTDKQNVYNKLPKTFTTSEGVEVAGGLEMRERTFKSFIKNKDLFNKLKRGEYEKRI